MLTEKLSLPCIRVFKLSTGEEIIAKVVEQTIGEYKIQDPCQLAQTQAGLRFVPAMFMAEVNKPMSLSKSLIVIEANPSEKVQSQFESAISGIALPQKSAIIT